MVRAPTRPQMTAASLTEAQCYPALVTPAASVVGAQTAVVLPMRRSVLAASLASVLPKLRHLRHLEGAGAKARAPRFTSFTSPPSE